MERPIQIDFDRDYCKFGGRKLPFPATLLQCFKVPYRELSEGFKHYDVTSPQGDFKLPQTDLIVLLLLLDDGKLCTTVRFYTPKRQAFYRKHEGELVDLVYSEPSPAEEGKQPDAITCATVRCSGALCADSTRRCRG